MTDIELDHVTLADPDLTHQVYFGISDNKNQVTCNCRRVKNKIRGNYHPNYIGPAKDINEARALYNDPANHKAPFDPEKDSAKW